MNLLFDSNGIGSRAIAALYVRRPPCPARHAHAVGDRQSGRYYMHRGVEEAAPLYRFRR